MSDRKTPLCPMREAILTEAGAKMIGWFSGRVLVSEPLPDGCCEHVYTLSGVRLAGTVSWRGPDAGLILSPDPATTKED